ncbi:MULTISPECIES: terminase family protein [unclassified Neisseria]|uniref:terminase large subunit domain-containing protein n=1 Tax=unclassified Neisseria TaxID=2623750 RepID=UPI001D16CA24|nr:MULTISPECIES: terminase family protein [unclassified Neisseria]
MALLPYQQAWCADQSPVKLCEKSRRIGLSWGEAADTALLAASAKGMDAWYIGYNKDMALEFIRDCAGWAKHYQLAAGEIEETEEVFVEGDDRQAVLAFVIRFASGWRITALSSRPSNLRGKQGRVIIDEAAFHDQLSELLKAAMALLMWGGQVHIISTHDGIDNPFNELINDVRAGKKPYSIHRITFNEAVEQGLYRRICLRLSREWTEEGEAAWCKEIRDFYGEDASEELDCIPKNGGGKWLSRALIESRMSPYTPVIRYDQTDAFGLMPEHKRAAEVADWIKDTLQPLLDGLDKTRVSFVGEDFARSGDRTVIVPLLQQQNLMLVPPFVLELGNMPFKQQEQIIGHLVRHLPNLRGAAFDARGNGQSLAEAMQDMFGASVVEPVMLSENWYRLHTAQFKAALEDGTLDGLPRDEDILNDLRAFELINGVPRIPVTRTKGADGQKRHGDAGIALVLAHYASRELNNGPVNVSSRKVSRRSRLTRGYN